MKASSSSVSRILSCIYSSSTFKMLNTLSVSVNIPHSVPDLNAFFRLLREGREAERKGEKEKRKAPLMGEGRKKKMIRTKHTFSSFLFYTFKHHKPISLLPFLFFLSFIFSSLLLYPLHPSRA